MIKVDGNFYNCCRKNYYGHGHSAKCITANKIYMEELEHQAKILEQHHEMELKSIN